jgi:hypothetical protein
MARPELMEIEDFDLETLVGLAERLAVEEADGHLSIMRFTSGWKVVLQTPDLDTGGGREEVANIQSFGTLKEALVYLLTSGME